MRSCTCRLAVVTLAAPLKVIACAPYCTCREVAPPGTISHCLLLSGNVLTMTASAEGAFEPPSAYSALTGFAAS